MNPAAVKSVGAVGARPRSAAILSILLAIAGLMLPAIAPEVANIGVIVLAVLGLIVVRHGPAGKLVRQPAVLMPALSISILAVSQVLTARSAQDLIPLVALAPVLLVLPIALLLYALPRPAWAIHGLALTGVAAAAALTLYEVYVVTLGRGGMSVANPIHFADACIVMAIVASSGLAQSHLRGRWLLLAAPVLASVAVYLSGSRGALLAIPGIALAQALAWLLFHLRWRRAVMVEALILVFGAAALVALLQAGLLTLVPGVSEIRSLLAGAAPSPGSIGDRIAMYQGALGAFFDSPWVGHGLSNYFAIATKDIPDGLLSSYDHLHSDVADFAVAGGILGLAAYAMLIFAPLVQAIAARRQPVPLVLGGGLASGYLLMGLTNAVIGIVTLTVLYSFCLAVQLRLSIAPA